MVAIVVLTLIFMYLSVGAIINRVIWKYTDYYDMDESMVNFGTVTVWPIVLLYAFFAWLGTPKAHRKR